MSKRGKRLNRDSGGSNILTGTRMTGVKEAKQDRQNKAALGVLSVVPYVGIIGALGALAPTREPTALEVTMFLQPLGQNQTQIRIKMQKNGEPVWDQTTINRLMDNDSKGGNDRIRSTACKSSSI